MTLHIMDQKNTKKTVRTFSFASFLNDLGSDMISPIWPIFITTVLGAPMSILGLIDGLGEAIVSISQAISGYISDKIRKRKIFIWLGYFFAGLSRWGYAISTIWQQIIPFRILDRLGKIRDAPRDAILADISVKKNRGRNFGILEAMDSLGAVFGIIICILFFEKLGYRNLFMIAAIPSFIAVLLVLFIIKEKKSEDIHIYKGMSFKDLDKNFKIFLTSSAFFGLGSFTYSFLLIYAKEFGFKVTFIPILYLIFTACTSLFALPFGKISDKIGRKNVLIISYILWILVCLSFIFIHNYLAIILTFFLYGLHKGALKPVQKTFVSELAPSEYKASTLGGFQMIMGLCALPASLTAGILWDKLGLFIPLYFSLAVTIISIITLFFVREKK